MGQLAKYLQDQFVARAPPGWSGEAEARVLDTRFEEFLGYAPQADVRLVSNDGRFRLWIEFEVSRADPVANHAKFATAHLFQPQRQTDTFVSMMSSHVAKGRRNLAANTVLLMRRIGMRAFQTVLLPTCSPAEVKKLNTAGQPRSTFDSINIDAEIDRALCVARPCLESTDHEIHFVGELLDVACNIAIWNREFDSVDGQKLWGRRRVTYFAFDPGSGQFAPAKFCAFLDAKQSSPADVIGNVVPMTMSLYVSLDESEARFDGNRAQRHLTDKLGMVPVRIGEDERISALFGCWHAKHGNAITLDVRGPVILKPPDWYR